MGAVDPTGRGEVAGAAWCLRVASGGDAFEASEAGDAISAFGVELVGEAGGPLAVLVVREVAAVTVFDCDCGELAHGGRGGVGRAAARSNASQLCTLCERLFSALTEPRWGSEDRSAAEAD